MTITASSVVASRKRGLFSAFQLIEAFRELRSEMPIHIASVFLLIAMKPGIGQRELLDLIDVAQATISRAIALLTERDRHGKPGLNLVVQMRNPSDARNTMLYLTPAGEELVKRVLSVHRSHG